MTVAPAAAAEATAGMVPRWRAASRLSLGARLTLTFVLVILLISLVFVVVGMRLISDRVMAEAQERVTTDLNAAHEIYALSLDRLGLILRLSAVRPSLKRAAADGNAAELRRILNEIRITQGLDILNATDGRGRVLARPLNPQFEGVDIRDDPMVRWVLDHHQRTAATAIVPFAELAMESVDLVRRAELQVVETAMAPLGAPERVQDGMMLRVAEPVFGDDGSVIAVLVGGVMLNRNYELVDRIKRTLFQDATYHGTDIGTATIFQDQVRIATNVKNRDGSRAVGTLASAPVYERVVRRGERWLGRAFVVNNWYITAYEPIRDFQGRPIGMLYVGILEQRYAAARWAMARVFLLVALSGALASMALAYAMSRGLSRAIAELARASRQLAAGDLDARALVHSRDELQELADTLNTMAAALKERDAQIREMARTRIQRSERLAMVGQLAAGVAHELNNPMQGIVAYAMLLREEMAETDARREMVDQIVTQAERCTKIVRSLLDFARQRPSESRPTDINKLITDTLALVERQALFHNVRVERQLGPDVPLITVDPAQIQQVLMNLVINAVEAMDGEGTLTVGTRLRAGGSMVEIVVSDTGHGISPENLDRIFVPFFTTKEETHGVGLGLAISYRIVRDHGGAITVESEVGKGTTFAVRLPVGGEAEGSGDD